MKKKRADELLIEQNLVKDKEEAVSFILAGKVFTTDEIKILTAGEKLKADTELYIKGQEKRYVSRGGFKLEEALNYFNISLQEKIVLDIGASTGGFTDVSLQKGAKSVYALDVGTNQLAWKLRNDERVIVMEQTNFRHSIPEDFTKGTPEFASIDVSFISLELILPPLYSILKDKGEVIALIKPQFEADRADIGEGGIVTDVAVYRKVIEKVIHFAAGISFSLQGLTISPITGSKGNIEFLAYFIKDGEQLENSDQLIEEVLDKATQIRN